MSDKRLTKLEKYWILYDVGNSAFVMLVSTIIPIYFKNLASANGVSAADSTAYFGYAISVSTVIVAILGPILGAVADNKGFKRNLFTCSMMIGVIGCAGMAVPVPWLAFLAIFIIAKVGYNSSLIFYDAMLPDVTSDERMDRISSSGYAWGYIGSCIPFIASLLLVLFSGKIGLSATTATGIAFILNAVWWFVITLPLLKNYKQVHYIEVKAPIADSFRRLGKIFGELKQNKKISIFLLAFFFYIDGVFTIIGMATSYGKDVGITDNHLLLALLLTQIIAFPCAIVFGKVAGKVEAKRLISICIIAYFFITVFALQLDKAWEFWLLAVAVAVFQGGIQALSRSYYAKIIPKEKSSEYFGIYDIFGKGASFMGTTLMGISSQLSGSSKTGVAVIAVMFLIGFLVFRIHGKSVEAQ